MDKTEIYRAAVTIYCASFVTFTVEMPDYKEERRDSTMSFQNAVDEARAIAALVEKGGGE